MPRPLPRNAIRALRVSATATAAGLLALGTPAPGQAAEAAPSLEFTHGLGDKPVEAKPYGTYSGPVHVHARNTGSQELKDFTVTIDATALKGQMKLSASPACVEKQQLLFTCDGEKLNEGRPLAPGGLLRAPGVDVMSLADARPGFTGEVRVFGEAGGVLLGETTFKAAVADMGPLIDRDDSSDTRTKPGATLRPAIGFTHFSPRPLKGVHIGIRLSQGLSYAEEFSNCEYGDRDDYGVGARCYVETPVEPGGSYDLDRLSLKVGDTALHESWHLHVNETAEGYEYLKLTDVHRGTGRKLRLVPRAAGPGVLDEEDSSEASDRVTVANAMDYEAVGATVHGKAGQVVKAELGIRNNGPATIRNWMGEPGDGATSSIAVVIPPGTTAVKAPDGCTPVGASGARRYTCSQDLEDSYFEAKELTPFVFELRIDTPGDLAPGSIKASRPYEDDDVRNNTAAITVTFDGKPAGTAEGSTAGSGPGALLRYAAAAGVALAASATLFAVVRRRKAH
ncbi:hypothetical protein ABZ471_35690 [Streptomyces sp. NPDC005728]|uniref:hypothetical protein n=1 Tax=Streptomyces sp. NPDC005728 TaxID=3157054 RepID=UPI00340E3046